MDGITLGGGEEPCAIVPAEGARGTGRRAGPCAGLVQPAVAARKRRAVVHGIGAG